MMVFDSTQGSSPQAAYIQYHAGCRLLRSPLVSCGSGTPRTRATTSQPRTQLVSPALLDARASVDTPVGPNCSTSCVSCKAPALTIKTSLCVCSTPGLCVMLPCSWWNHWLCPVLRRSQRCAVGNTRPCLLPSLQGKCASKHLPLAALFLKNTAPANHPCFASLSVVLSFFSLIHPWGGFESHCIRAIWPSDAV